MNIPIVIESGPLPEADAEEPMTKQHRLYHITWQLFTAPPESGHYVTVKITDLDNADNFTQVVVLQTESKMLVPITLTARQFRIRLSASVNIDFDPQSFGYSYQTLNRPYWRR